MTTSRNKRILLILSSIPHKESAQFIFLQPLLNLGRNFVEKNVKSIWSTLFFRVFGCPKSNQLLSNYFEILFFSDKWEAKLFAAKNNALCIPTQGFLMRNKLVICLVIPADSLLLTHSGHLWRLTNHNPILEELQEHLSNRYSPLDQGIPSQQPREHVLYMRDR